MNYMKKISDILELTFGVDKSLITEKTDVSLCLEHHFVWRDCRLYIF